LTQVLCLMTCIQEMLGSNLIQDTGFPVSTLAFFLCTFPLVLISGLGGEGWTIQGHLKRWSGFETAIT
jgi:hypothetical protein